MFKLFFALLISGNAFAGILPDMVAVTSALAPNTYIFSSSFAPFVPVATATDMLVIKGSATKTVKVIDFVVCPSATAAGAQTMYLVKRSTADSGGTSTSVPGSPLDSLNANVTASVASYSGNPSLGTTVWARPRRVFFQITAGTSAMEPCLNLLQYLQDNIAAQPVVLRGTGESLALNNNGAALASGYRIDAWYAIVTEE